MADDESTGMLSDLLNARAALDRLAHKLRDGGPDIPRADIRRQVEYAARIINEYAPRSILRVIDK